jgi:hypothetical protein
MKKFQRDSQQNCLIYCPWMQGCGACFFLSSTKLSQLTNWVTNSVAPETEGSSPHSRNPGHRSLPRTKWIHSTPTQPTSLRSIVISSSLLCLELPGGHFLLDFRTKSFYTSFYSATCLAHLILLDLIYLIIHLRMSTNHKGPHCATSSMLLLLYPS